MSTRRRLSTLSLCGLLVLACCWTALCSLYNDRHEYSQSEFHQYLAANLRIGISTPVDVETVIGDERLQARTDHIGVRVGSLQPARDFGEFLGVFPDRQNDVASRIPDDGFAMAVYVANPQTTMKLSFCSDDFYTFVVFDAEKKVRGWFSESEWTCL
jgi:hypothetical protein